VVGGVGIGGNLIANANVAIYSTNNPSGANVGALQVAGGIGSQGNIYTNGNIGWSTGNVSAVYQFYNPNSTVWTLYLDKEMQ